MDLANKEMIAFFEALQRDHLAVTFDDVRLKTGEFCGDSLSDISLETLFSRNVPLRIPIVSAAMDTVTEHKLAIEMARFGGLGIIHKNLSPEKQAHEVGRVKHFIHGFVEKPICVAPDQTVEAVLGMKREKGYGFDTFPVLDGYGKLVGILTGNDFDFEDRGSLVSKAMTKEVVTAPRGTTVDQAYDLLREHKKKVLPILGDDGLLIGLYTLSDITRIKSGTSAYNLDAKGQLRVGAAIGVLGDAYERVEQLINENVDVVVIDTAHADSKNVYETLKELKRKYGSLDVVVGNVSEAPSARRLLDAGADGIKVGQGGGSICTTRIIAGIGCPQVSAVYQCAKDVSVPICSDGGIRYSGDVTIALGAGAHSVMLGNALAGTEETPGQIVLVDGRQWKMYRGMGSLSAMQEHAGSRARYKLGSGGTLIPEGVEGLVPYRGNVGDVLTQFVGGLRSGMGSVGALTIDELHSKAIFHRISSAGQTESHPHDIKITQEAPNYRGKQ